MAGFRSLVFLLVSGFAAISVFPLHTTERVELGLVETSHGLSVMRHEVTIAQWRACVEDGGCSFQPPAKPGADRDDFPVTNIGALDAQQFVEWARETVDPGLRLPTLEEWYVFSGVVPYRAEKIFTDPRLAWAAFYGSEGKIDPTLRPSGSFGANAQGIADVKGNVWEWTSSCVVGSAQDRCPAYFAAGEHEAKIPVFVRDPATGGCATGTPPAHLGFRLVSSRAK